MWKYCLRRILMMLPTLFGITILSFLVIQLAPGSPVEQKIQSLRAGSMGHGGSVEVSPAIVEALNKQYGFDKPIMTRYFIWLKKILTLDFGESFTYEEPVIDVILSKFPVSLQFGLLSFVLVYLVCIPLGVLKAVHNGSAFDTVSSIVLFFLYSVPPLMLGVLLMVFFAGGSFWNWFPAAGISSLNYDTLSTGAKILDRIHHFILPGICYVIGSFTVMTLLMKNSIIDEIKSDYVRTARAKGLDEKKVIYRHALRNALIPIVTGLGAELSLFLAGSIIIESLFSLDGIGQLGYKSALSRDYNVLMALIFITGAVSLIGRLISDLLYVLVDPRIDFDSAK